MKGQKPVPSQRALPTVLCMSCVFAGSLFPGPALLAQSDEFGQWIDLFNGKDTTGWKNVDGKSPNAWAVEDGALTQKGPGATNDACTAAEFESYELSLEYKVPPGGNSGVYLRGCVEVQVLDSFRKPGDATPPQAHDAGAIYGSGAPLKISSKPAGEWNRFRIVHIGRRITVYHNDVLVQDNVYVAGDTPGNMKGPSGRTDLDGSKGPVMLQGNHSKVWYRSIRIRPLVDARAGWKPLWNGKDLSQFTAHGDARAKDGLRWSVKDNAFTNGDNWGSKGHDIWTQESFGNFLVHYEYKSGTSEGGNSGFYLRDQWEIQIYGTSSLGETHDDGDLYSIKSADVLARNAPDQWNQVDVKLVGNKVWVWQNGKLLHDGVELKTRTDNHAVATPIFSKAPFKLQGDHGAVTFTNLYIKPLADV